MSADRGWPSSEATTPVQPSSPWAVLAGIVLFLLGLPFLAGGFDIGGRGLAHGADSGGVREAMAALGGVFLFAGAAQVIAAILIWMHREAGRILGLVIGAIGAVLGGIAFYVYLRSALEPTEGGTGAIDFIGFVAVLPYLVVLVGLVAGRRHFPR